MTETEVFEAAKSARCEATLRGQRRDQSRALSGTNASVVGIDAFRRADAAAVAELDEISEVLLRIEIVVLVLVEAAALDHRVAARLVFGDGFGAIRVEQLHVVQAFAFLLQ